MCVGASTVCFSCVFLRDVVTLWVKSVFVATLFGASRCIHPSSFGFSELLVAGGRAITWLVTDL